MDDVKIAIVLAGLGQLVLVVASIAIPRCLEWKKPLATLPQLLRQIFWTYAGYILGMHTFFGLLSLLAPHWLLDGTSSGCSVNEFNDELVVDSSCVAVLLF